MIVSRKHVLFHFLSRLLAAKLHFGTIAKVGSNIIDPDGGNPIDPDSLRRPSQVDTECVSIDPSLSLSYGGF